MAPARMLVPELPWVTADAPLMTPVEDSFRMALPAVEMAPPPVSEPVKLSVPALIVVAPV